MFLAQSAELVSPGGPSAPVWAFLSAISLALIAIIPAVISARHNAKGANDKASKAAESASQVAENTQAVSNGFADRVDRQLALIIDNQSKLDSALRDHFQWHAERQ